MCQKNKKNMEKFLIIDMFEKSFIYTNNSKKIR